MSYRDELKYHATMIRAAEKVVGTGDQERDELARVVRALPENDGAQRRAKRRAEELYFATYGKRP